MQAYTSGLKVRPKGTEGGVGSDQIEDGVVRVGEGPHMGAVT